MTNSNLPVLDFMKTRRSVPAKMMGGPGPSSDEIRQMIEIAIRVPDHGKIAPWRFINYTRSYCEILGKKILERTVELNSELDQEMREIEQQRFTRSPTIIGLISKPVDHPKVPEWEQVLSCGAAGMNLLIAANAVGYDAQWITEWVAFDEILKADLGAGQDERIAGFIHIGTRTMPKSERDRPTLEKVYSTLGE